MLVNLQVVGIFYNSEVNVTDENPTVKSLLDAAVSLPGRPGDVNQANKFAYSTNTTGGKTFASTFSASFLNPVQPRVLSRPPYPKGTYQLGEHVTDRPAYTVWQYYMFDAQGRFLNPEKSATPFGSQSLKDVPVPGTAETADVCRVSWRLVTILAQPTGPAAPDQGSEYIGV